MLGWLTKWWDKQRVGNWLTAMKIIDMDTPPLTKIMMRRRCWRCSSRGQRFIKMTKTIAMASWEMKDHRKMMTGSMVIVRLKIWRCEFLRGQPCEFLGASTTGHVNSWGWVAQVFSESSTNVLIWRGPAQLGYEISIGQLRWGKCFHLTCAGYFRLLHIWMWGFWL